MDPCSPNLCCSRINGIFSFCVTSEILLQQHSVEDSWTLGKDEGKLGKERREGEDPKQDNMDI